MFNRLFNSKNLNYLQLFLLSLCLVVLLRLPTLFRAVIDSDESTYLLMARQWLNGLHLYSEIWDTKPPGIVFLFAGLFKLTGVSIPALRILSAIFHATTLTLIWQILRSLKVAISPLLIILTALLFLSTKTYSLAANTEIFFITFTLAAVALLLEAKKWWHYLLAGLLLGIGFEIKYFVLFDFFALALLITLTSKQRWRDLAIFSSAFITPFLLVLLYFYQSSSWQDFYYVTFVIPRKYSGNIDFNNLRQFAWQYLRAPGALLLLSIPLIIINRKSLTRDRHFYFLLSWFLLTSLATIVPKTFFGHYLLQIIPVGLLLFLYHLNRVTLSRKLLATLISLELIVLLLITNNFYRKYIKDPDPVKKIATILKQQLLPKEQIFITTSGYQILYHLLNRPIPTKYVHPSLLFKKERANRLGIPVDKELSRIYHGQSTLISINQAIQPTYPQRYRQHSYPISNATTLYLYRKITNI